MGSLRVRWKPVARGAALALALLLAMRVLPGLLGPGPPPPLAADIGLPRPSRVAPACRVAACRGLGAPGSPIARIWPARALAREPRRRKARAPLAPAGRAHAVAPPAPVSPPAYEPAPAPIASPAPAPPAPAPNDGSMEFTPH